MFCSDTCSSEDRPTDLLRTKYKQKDVAAGSCISIRILIFRQRTDEVPMMLRLSIKLAVFIGFAGVRENDEVVGRVLSASV
jgi:hypothetical protein